MPQYPLESNRKSRALFSLCVGGGSFERAAHFEAALSAMYFSCAEWKRVSCTCSRAKVKHVGRKTADAASTAAASFLLPPTANLYFGPFVRRPTVHGFYYSRRGADCFFRR